MFASFLIRGVITGMKQGMQNLGKQQREDKCKPVFAEIFTYAVEEFYGDCLCTGLGCDRTDFTQLYSAADKSAERSRTILWGTYGKSVIVRAKKVNQDYAASLSGTSDNSKENASNADKASDAGRKIQKNFAGI